MSIRNNNSRMMADKFYPTETFHQDAPEGQVTMAFVEDEEHKLLEVFIWIGKAGSVTAAWASSLQGMINYLLSQHLPYQEILNILSNQTSGSSVTNWETGIVCRSGPEAVYICFLRYLMSKAPKIPREQSREYDEPFNPDDIP